MGNNNLMRIRENH